MMSKTRVLPALAVILAVGAAAWVSGSGIDSHIRIRPLYFGTEAGGQPGVAVVDTTHSDSPQAWLRVEVETSWGWFWQTSIGRAYVMVEKNSKRRMKVGRLCLRLEAHGKTEQCVTDGDSLIIVEKKRGMAIPKRTAVATAWAEAPNLDTTSVALEP